MMFTCPSCWRVQHRCRKRSSGTQKTGALCRASGFAESESEPAMGHEPPDVRELHYHIWLRGADGMFLFNLGYPNSGVTPDFSFHSVEDARQVYDDLLAQS